MKTETMWDVLRKDWRNIVPAVIIAALAGILFVFLWLSMPGWTWR